MMVIGIDPHKRTHTAVAVDEVGRKKDERTVQARDHGHVQLLVWARKLVPEERVCGRSACSSITVRHSLPSAPG
ncbi:hypothetical protein [Nonomuraea sp. NPDC005501]|uniref:hypothetical protein n=1 Tax=Nonomuraea sp. NPDC005501 TaxID=3156884 RepID=UPI0033A0F25A